MNTTEDLMIEMNVCEDVWSLSLLKITGTVKRFTNTLLPFLRYDENNNLVEKYKTNSIETTTDNIAKELYDTELFAKEYMVSESSNEVITDYYFSHKLNTEHKIPHAFTAKYNLKKELADISIGALLRYNTNKELLGIYYGGQFNSLGMIYYSNNLQFIDCITNYYSTKNKNLQNLGCIVKDFGNQTCYILYNND